MHVPIRPKRRGQFRPNGSTARQQRNVDPWGGGFTHYGPLVTTTLVTSLPVQLFVTSPPVLLTGPHGLLPIGHNFPYVTSGLLLASGLCSVSGLLTCQHHRPYHCKANSLSGHCQTVFCVAVTVSLPSGFLVCIYYVRLHSAIGIV